jgi:hypothetical protein
MGKLTCWCSDYEIDTVGEPGEEKLDDAIKKFLAIGKDKYPGAKKPENVTRKGDK